MSAPATDVPSSSISSSGHEDGLGRRVLAFDRETGAILERLHLRAELAAFEGPLRARVEKLSVFEDDRFARPLAVERTEPAGDLTVLSEFVAGSRITDLLETSQDGGLVPGVDVALGFLLEALPAIAAFHTATGFTHGLIDPSRSLLTPGGQIVILDSSFGASVERLGLSRMRLWKQFGVASPAGLGQVRFDVAGDIAQTALNAVMLVLGRRVRLDEYPDGLPSLLMEVVEVAQIRGASAFASGLQRVLQRSLPLPGRRPYSSADEAILDVRQLVRREIGVEVCQRALVEFIDQMDLAFGSGRGAEEAPHADHLLALELDDELAGVRLEVVDETAEPGLDLGDPASEGLDFDEEEAVEEMEIALDDSELQSRPAFDLPSLEIPAHVTFDSVPELTASAPPSRPEPSQQSGAPSVNRSEWSADRPETAPAAVPFPEVGHDALLATPPAATEPEAAAAPVPENRDEGGARRRKRQQRSARARKDRLRSATTAQHPVSARPPAPQPAPVTPAKSGWIVSPDRAAAFEPPVPQPAPPLAAPVAIGRPAPAVSQPLSPSYPPPPPAYGAGQPGASLPPAPLQMPVYGVPTVPIPAPTPAAAPVAAPRPAAAAPAPLKLKTEPPPGFAPPRRTRNPYDELPVSPYAQQGSMFQPEPPAREFPWKLAAAVVILTAVAAVAGRAYIPGRAAAEEEAPVAAAEPAPAIATPPPARTPGTGQIAITTDPAGARVLLDGKPVGETPLKLESVPAGRHVLTFVSASGEVKKTVRVTSGKVLSLDVPIFSGWVAVFAPIVLDVSVNGKSIGTTEQNRLMLPPGRHVLTVSNAELGFMALETVEVEAGEVRSVTIDPRGPVNINAVPWAEVWTDGRRLGETPLANTKVALGVREFVFKHPEHGERRVTATVRGDAPTVVSVDFTRPPQ